jgi:hypothetical protein
VFDLALVSGLQHLLMAGSDFTLDQDGAPVWFAAALAQLQLYQQARGSPTLAKVLEGSGVVSEEFIRCVQGHNLHYVLQHGTMVELSSR